MSVVPPHDGRELADVSESRTPTIEPGVIDLVADGPPINVLVKIPGERGRKVRVWAADDWLRVEPSEVTCSSAGASVSVWVDSTSIPPLPPHGPTVATVLHGQRVPVRHLDGAVDAPVASASVRVTLRAQGPDRAEARAAAEDEASPEAAALPNALCPVHSSLAEIEFPRVPPDGTQKRTLVLTWVGRDPGTLTIRKCPEWIVVHPLSVDFREGRRDRAVEVEVVGRLLPIGTGLESDLYLDAQSSSGGGVSRVVIRAAREVEGSIENRARRNQAISFWAFSGTYVLYLLMLIMRVGLPMHGVGLAAVVPVALAMGIFTYRGSREHHALILMAIVSLAALVLGGVLAPNFLRTAVLVLVPAVGIPVVWQAGGLLFRRHPTSIAMVGLLPLGVALVCGALLAVLMPVSELPSVRSEPVLAPVRTTAAPASGRLVPETQVEPAPAASHQTERPPSPGARLESQPSATAPATPAEIGARSSEVGIPDDLGALRKFVRTHGASFHALNKLARMESAVGRADRAVELYRKSLSLNPDQMEVKEQLRRLEELLGREK